MTVTNDANVGITCVVCHDPHQTNSNPFQLRNPIRSTNDFFLTTSEVFTNKYNANTNINLCAQCHNHRGASWTSTSRPPHHSPQYNMLLGSVGELASGTSAFAPSSHALLITNQCVSCHMEKSSDPDISHPGTSGHSFAVTSYDSCLQCHPFPELLTVFTTHAVTNRISQIKGYLDLWAAYEAPAGVWTKYGVRAWEYTTIGELVLRRFRTDDHRAGAHSGQHQEGALQSLPSCSTTAVTAFTTQITPLLCWTRRRRGSCRNSTHENLLPRTDGSCCSPPPACCWSPSFPAAPPCIAPWWCCPEVPGAKYIGSSECEQCHEEISRSFKTADHARLLANGKNGHDYGCESCHGPASLHSDSGGETKPP